MCCLQTKPRKVIRSQPLSCYFYWTVTPSLTLHFDECFISIRVKASEEEIRASVSPPDKQAKPAKPHTGPTAAKAAPHAKAPSTAPKKGKTLLQIPLSKMGKGAPRTPQHQRQHPKEAFRHPLPNQWPHTKSASVGNNLIPTPSIRLKAWSRR